MSDGIIDVPAWDGRAQLVGEVWRLRKAKREAVCTLWTHPMGGEVRIHVGRELWRAEPKLTSLAANGLAHEWLSQFQDLGWQPSA